MKKKHHSPPIFYLRKFTTLEPKEMIWTFDMEKDDPRCSTVENTAYIKYDYSMTSSEGKRLDHLEELIANKEKNAAPVHDKLISGVKITDQERADYASFMAIMLVRTHAFRQQYADIGMNLLQLQMYTAAKREDSFKSYVKQYERDCGPLSEDQVENLRQGMLNPHKYTISVDKEWTLKALGFHDDIFPVFFDMNWSVMEARGSCYFITSDNPLIFNVPSKHCNPLSGGGLTHKKVEVTFPLSMKTCLLATWDKKRPNRFEINDDIVKGMNQNRAAYAKRFLYSPRNDIDIERLKDKFKGINPSLKFSGFQSVEWSPVTLRRSKSNEIED